MNDLSQKMRPDVRDADERDPSERPGRFERRRLWRPDSLRLPDASATMYRQKMTALDVTRLLQPGPDGALNQEAISKRIEALYKRMDTKSGKCDWTAANEVEMLLVGGMSLEELRIEARRQLLDAHSLQIPAAGVYESLIDDHQDNAASLRTTLVRLIGDIQSRFRKRYLLREYVSVYTARVSLLFGVATTMFAVLIIALSMLAYGAEKTRIEAVGLSAFIGDDGKSSDGRSTSRAGDGGRVVRTQEAPGASAEVQRSVGETGAKGRTEAPPEEGAPSPTGAAGAAAGSATAGPGEEPAAPPAAAAALLEEKLRLLDGMNPLRAFSSFYIALMAGLFGAAFSMMAQTRKRVESSSLEDMKTNARFAMLFFRLGVGIGAAMILYFIFDTQVIGNGSLTPDLKQVGFDAPKSGIKLIAIGALSPNHNLSLLMLWCFVAGFSEVLVPTILRQTEQRVTDK